MNPGMTADGGMTANRGKATREGCGESKGPTGGNTARGEGEADPV